VAPLLISFKFSLHGAGCVSNTLGVFGTAVFIFLPCPQWELVGRGLSVSGFYW